MTIAQPDNAASAPLPHPFGPAGRTAVDDDAVRAARAWRRVIGALVWLAEELDAISLALIVQMGRIAGYRKRHGRAALTIDINLPFDLISRAMRWIRALELRLVVEAVRAKAALNAAKGWPDPPERLDDSQDWHENFDPPRRRRERVDPADIDGRPTVEVFAQIMADLVVAALLLGDIETARRLEAIGHAVRDLLGDRDEAWRPLPICAAPVPEPAPVPEVVTGVPVSAPVRVAAPGTG